MGHDEGGQLTERVRRNPWSVVLLDELEKAHRVWSILPPGDGGGVLTDAQGRRTDFRNTVLVMTSNLGARHFRAQGRLGFLPEEGTDRAEVERAVLAEARRTFAPELLNRLDGTLVFHPLDGDSLAAITRQLLDQTGERLSALGVSLQVGGGGRPAAGPGGRRSGLRSQAFCGGPSRPRWRIPPPTCCWSC